MIKNLTEIIIHVQDMDAQVKFYRDVLSLPIDHPGDLASYRGVELVVFQTGTCKLALHGGGKKKFGRDAPKFVFDVDDIRGTRELLSLKGVKLGKIRTPAPGVEIVDGEDPEGNLFSLESRVG